MQSKHLQKGHNMKAKGNFKLSKTSKRMIATIVDPHQRGALKRAMIQAELAAAIVPKREKRPQGTTTQTTAE